jgi:integrase
MTELREPTSDRLALLALWYARLRPNWTERDWMIAVETQKAAAKLGLSSILPALQAFAAQGAAPTFSDCIPVYLQSRINEGLQPLSIANDRAFLGAFARRFGDQPPGQIAPDEIATYLAQWSNQNSVRTYQMRAYTFFDWAVRMRYAVVNPILRLAPIRPTQGRGRHYTPSEAGFILRQAVNTSLIGFWVLTLFSGMRISEIKRMRLAADPWRWFGLDHKYIDVPAANGKIRARRAAIHPTLWLWLKWLKARGQPLWPRLLEHQLGAQKRKLIARSQGVPEARLPLYPNRLGYFNQGRRSFITYQLALPGASYLAVARCAGTSENMIRRYYRRDATLSEANAYFEHTPERIVVQ